MNEADKALKVLLERLHTAEHDLEHANAVILDRVDRLNTAEMVLHEAIVKIERIQRGEVEPVCTGVLVHSEYEICPRCDR